jgi:tRNA (cytidine/uridine-2'-O-)-methyltransferase
MKDPWLNIVLIEPEIPQNTGNIMRTAIATNARLHLVEPLGFILDDHHLRRSGLDYLKDLDLTIHPSLDAFFKLHPENLMHFYSRYGTNRHDQGPYNPDGPLWLVFGKESSGIDKDVLAGNIERVHRIPTSGNVRSLNLSNAVAIVVYESLRQRGFPGLWTHEPDHFKGKDVLNNHRTKDINEKDT